MLYTASNTDKSFYDPADYKQDTTEVMTTREINRIEMEDALAAFYQNGGTTEKLPTYANKY